MHRICASSSVKYARARVCCSSTDIMGCNWTCTIAYLQCPRQGSALSCIMSSPPSCNLSREYYLTVSCPESSPSPCHCMFPSSFEVVLLM